MNKLLDDEGENIAVRTFLMFYTVPSITVGEIRRNMKGCGYPHWPEWASAQDEQHLTKAGAQLWLRHLFALEGKDGL